MRWKAVLALAMIAAAAAGCKQPCFQSESDSGKWLDIGLPADLETNPTPAVLPAMPNGPLPATVVTPEREIHHISLAEALAMALEHGTPGSLLLNGTTDDNLVTLQGAGVLAPENPIRVLALNPAVAGSDIEASLSKFDALWTTSMTWQRTDEPLGGNVLQDFNNGDHAQFTSSLLKPLPTGGVAGITFNTQYTLLSSPPFGVTNPSYRPSLQFQFEQPLLQGFGVDINQLRTTHPGSILTPFTTSGRVSGILITRTRFDQERAEFERQVHILLVNVEVAYWNLYGAYWSLYSREQALRQAYEAWRTNKAFLDAGRVTVADLEQARGQYELFRNQRLEAMGQVLESEHQLRGLIGLPVEDGTRLVPIDEPTLASYQPDWPTSLNDALTRRPELVLSREDLKLRQFDVINQKNLLLPDLRFTSTYNLNGLGTHLDGGSGDPNNAFSSLGSNQFHDWSLGLRLEVPIGFRNAHAGVRAAQLRLTQSYLTLRDQETKAERFLDQQYRALFQFYLQIQALREQRKSLGTQVGVRYQEFQTGKITLNILLEAQRFWADALRDEYAAIVTYNNALARFEYAKGTILEDDNVVISEGPLPPCAHVRAVENERERSKALALRERAKPIKHIEGVGLPELPPATAPSLPALQEGQPPVPDKLEEAPPPHLLAPAESQGQAPPGVSLGTPSASASPPLETAQWHPATTPRDGDSPISQVSLTETPSPITATLGSPVATSWRGPPVPVSIAPPSAALGSPAGTSGR